MFLPCHGVSSAIYYDISLFFVRFVPFSLSLSLSLLVYYKIRDEKRFYFYLFIYLEIGICICVSICIRYPHHNPDDVATPISIFNSMPMFMINVEFLLFCSMR